MTRRRYFLLGTAVAVLGAAVAPIPLTQADSLWQRRTPQHAYLVRDSRARQVGDLLTVIISQSTAVDNSENKGLRKTSGAGAKFDLTSATGGDIGTSSATGEFDTSNETQRNFSGEASYRNSRAFQDRMTVRVIAVDPAGNLVIDGSRGTHISGEQRVLQIRGVVRPIDIGPDNTIGSRFIADLHFTYEGKGAEPAFTKQGWLARKVNKIWPF